ncbi:unnamed protein product [Amoebophrya sp. A25]|nr:unnamed protein product [Amoebophrya sp. A25]|eukprot:GSA25T00014775001.1
MLTSIKLLFSLVEDTTSSFCSGSSSWHEYNIDGLGRFPFCLVSITATREKR